MLKHRLVPFAALTALALAGCDTKPEAPAAPSSEDAVLAGPATEAPAAEPSATEPGDGPLPTEIPEPIRGRWGLVPADCTSTRGDAKGLVVIDATSMKFYESVARLQRLKAADDDGLIGTFAFSGEGESWTLDVALEVEGDRNETLRRKDTGKDALPGPLEYTRCS